MGRAVAGAGNIDGLDGPDLLFSAVTSDSSPLAEVYLLNWGPAAP